MKKTALFVLLSALALSACSQAPIKSQDNRLSIGMPDGTLYVTPMADDAIRVQYIPEGIELPQLENLIYTEKQENRACHYSQSGNKVTVSAHGDGLRAVVNTRTGQIRFLDSKGKVILSEDVRSIQAGKTGDLNSLSVSQSFKTAPDEFLFGTGQFQDGYLNIRGLTRRLTQVNTQISIPMIISNKGYGILWNNYGLTDYNPSDFTVELQQGGSDGTAVTVNATGTAGNVRERRVFNDFSGEIEVKESGDYSILLDVGQSMARKHLLSIDGDTIINANNTWLPPTSSAITHLDKGTHKVFVSGSRGDKPSVGVRKVTDVTTFSSPVAVALDYTVFAGTADEIISSYRNLTGKVPQMPDWAFGYIHCRERYDSQKELLENAHRLKDEGYRTSVIVQDWQWWGKYGWNAMQFDETYYPDPKALTDSLHKMDIRLMLSVWSKIDKNSEVGKQMEHDGYYIPGTDWIDFFNPDAAAAYWKNFNERLVPTGIDAWWQDATEPENDDLAGRTVNNGRWTGEQVRNVYPLLVNKTVYEGLVKAGKEPMILTRCGFPGIQRYGSAMWSGDVGNDWDAFGRQIVAGLGMQAAGIPWWTYDAGGFFRPRDQYTNQDYIERMLRWIEASVYLPLMRVHGYMSNTEPWNYGDEAKQIIANCLKEREQLRPYIEACAERVSREGYTLMRPLIFDFADDETALRQSCEYMFGPELLVSPVTEPGVTEWRTYLPKQKGGWTEIHTGKHYDGGQYVTTEVSKAYIPVFKRTTN